MPAHDPAPEQVTGRFRSPASARAAMVRLEAAGIDADAIGLDAPAALATNDQAIENDLEATGDVTRRAAVGGTIGTAVGVTAGIVAGLVTGDAGAGAVVGTAGAVGGGAIGGLAGTYAGLPANQDAFETYELDPDDPQPVTVVVRAASAEQAEAARQALRGG